MRSLTIKSERDFAIFYRPHFVIAEPAVWTAVRIGVNRAYSSLKISNHTSLTERRGLLSEFIGDLKTVGELICVAEAYANAIRAYEEADIAYTIEWDANHIADKNIEFLQYALSRSDIKGPDDVELPYDFKGRVEYKREMLDTIISDLVDKDEG